MLTPWHPMVKSGFGTQHLRLVPFTADKIKAEPGALRFPMTMNPDFTSVPNCLVCMSAGARGRLLVDAARGRLLVTLLMYAARGCCLWMLRVDTACGCCAWMLRVVDAAVRGCCCAWMLLCVMLRVGVPRGRCSCMLLVIGARGCRS